MTHIILLDDGKLWAFEPPEKPKFYPGFQKKFIDEMATYNRAYSLAIAQRIEVENMYDLESILFDPETHEWWLMTSPEPKELKENEPIKWEGGFELIDRCQNGCNDGKDCEKYEIPGCNWKKLIRLIAPVKEENGVVDNLSKLGWIEPSLDTVNEIPDGPGNNYTTFGEPVPSEQENQEAIWKELFNLIEGPTSDRYIQAMKRFSITLK